MNNRTRLAIKVPLFVRFFIWACPQGVRVPCTPSGRAFGRTRYLSSTPHAHARSIAIWSVSMFLILGSTNLLAQVPAPGAPQSEPIAIMNGFAHLGNGRVIENSVITFRDGKIKNVVDAQKVRMDLSEYKQIDASGKHVYPGLVLLMSEIGLIEINAVRASNDLKEVGDINPNVRSAIAYNTDSELLPTLKFNGVQIMQVVPQGGRIPGTSSVMQLDAWNWEDALYLGDDAVHLNWPSQTRRAKYGTDEVGRQKNENFVTQKDEVVKLITDARAYQNNKPETPNLKLEAMQGVLSGDQQMFVRVNRGEDIVDAIQTLSEFDIPRVVLVGVREASKVLELIKESGYPVVLDNLHRLPSGTDLTVDNPYVQPALMQEAGVLSCISFLTHSNSNRGSARNLAFMAGTAAAYGLDKETALMMVTLNPARILGIDDRTGSLEAGKDANLVISEGDLLDMKSNKLTHSYIQGRLVDFDALQQRLYGKYKAKYSEN
jgi:imidazolonepropionase-like amidohydrolase